jgi:signal peptidase I
LSYYQFSGPSSTNRQSFIDVTGKESYRKEALIKRVIATEGDVVEIKNKVRIGCASVDKNHIQNKLLKTPFHSDILGFIDFSSLFPEDTAWVSLAFFRRTGVGGNVLF